MSSWPVLPSPQKAFPKRMASPLRRRTKTTTGGGVRDVVANRHQTADTPNLAAQGQSFSRKTAAEVPFTGLSFAPNHSLRQAVTTLASRENCQLRIA